MRNYEKVCPKNILYIFGQFFGGVVVGVCVKVSLSTAEPLSKMPKNILFSFKKVEKHTILASQGGGGKSPLLPSPAENTSLIMKNESPSVVNFINILQVGSAKKLQNETVIREKLRKQSTYIPKRLE